MSGPAVVPKGPVDVYQRYSDEIEMLQHAMDGRQAQIHTSLPGVIIKYDATTMTAEVQPAIKTTVINPDGTQTLVNTAPIHDVPVHFPGGGGHLLTFPVKTGDECLLMFSQRSIDHWFQLGGVQTPSDLRMHDINDCIAMVGLRSQPKVPGGKGGGSRANAGAPVSATTVQLRTDDGTSVIDVDGANKKITVNANGSTIVFDGTTNTITLTAPTVKINGELHVSGEIWGKFGGNAVSVTQHIHHALNQPPAVGTE